MRSKVDDFSDENNWFGDSDVSSFRSSACEHFPHISESSNMLCINSSHDSFSENNHNKGTLSNKYEDIKRLEDLDENPSSLRRSTEANIVNNSHKRKADGVNILHNSTFFTRVASEVSRNVPHSDKLSSCEVSSLNDADVAQAGNSSPKEKSNKVSTDYSGSLPAKDAASLVSDESMKHTFQDDKSKDTIEPNGCKHSSRSPYENECDDSDIAEHDIKVCDICGDAGHEAELAICSRCSDGAEHIYCMQHMLKKLPEGDWLCEECRADKTENQRQDAKAKLVCNVNSTPQISGKRLAQNRDTDPKPKRQVVESNSGSPNAKSIGQMLQESSFKSIGSGKIKPGHQMSSCGRSGSDFVGRVHSPTTVQRGLGPQGSLPKSNSFSMLNSKPKVKLVDEVPNKQKGTRQHTIKELKEGPGRLLSKSMSFKSVDSFGSNATESKVKMLSPKSIHVPDQKGLKQEKDWCASGRNKVDRTLGMTSSKILTHRIDQKPRPHVESSNKELRVAQDGKLSTLPKHSSILPHKDDSSAFSTVGVSASCTEQTSYHVNTRDDFLPSFSSSSAEKTSIGVGENQHNGLSQSGEFTNSDDKIKDNSGVCSVQAAAPKCKDVGHDTEVCSSDHASGSSYDVPATARPEGNVHNGNRLKAAIHAALLKRPEVCKKKVADLQSDDVLTSNSDFNCEIPSQDHNVFLNKSKNTMSAEVLLEGRATADNSTTESFKSTAGRDGKQLSVCSFDSFVKKPLVRYLPNEFSVDIPILMETSAIPEYEYIWQGLFKVLSSEKPPELFGGMQAHLSTSASAKVLKVVEKFPHRVHLNEMTRLSAWPSQFHQTGAREDNIALYFFAKDFDSYEKHYKTLLDRMMENDLTLKGNFDGIELLIFPSNQLPRKSQRWNTLFYLWGVFRGKSTDNSIRLQKAFVSTSNLTCSNTDLSPAVKTLCKPYCSQKLEESVALNQTCDVETCNTPDLMKECHGDGESDCKSLPETISTGGSSLHEKNMVHSVTYHTKENHLFPKVCVLDNQDTSVKNIGDENNFFNGTDGDCSGHNRELKEDICNNMEPNCWRDPFISEVHHGQIDEKNNVRVDLSETVMQGSKCMRSKMPGNKMNNSLSDGHSVCKKMKTGYDAFYLCSSQGGIDSQNETSAACTNELSSYPSMEDKLQNAGCDEKIIREDLGARERHLFPVDSHNMNDFLLGQKRMLRKGLQTENKDKHLDEVPNLELALGAEMKIEIKGTMPFLVGELDKKNNQDKPPGRRNDEQEENGEVTSLSLSLSFPSTQTWNKI